jgi:hypothetical protein
MLGVTIVAGTANARPGTGVTHKEGTLTISADTCKRDDHTKGDMFIVPGGSNQLHIGRNLGRSPVVVDEMYVDLASRSPRVSRTRGGPEIK